MKNLVMSILLAAAPLCAQQIQFPASFADLAEKAEEVVEITLDASMLGLAGNFLSAKEGEEAEAKKLIEGLKSITVRSFEFANEGEYSDADLDEIRAQLSPPEWAKIVSVREKSGDNSEIFLKKQGDQVAGLTVLAAEPKELTVVHIDGLINLEDIAKLGGKFGIPNMNLGPAEKPEQEN